MTPLPAPHKNRPRGSAYTPRLPSTELNSSSPPTVQPFSPVTLYWQGLWRGPRQPPGLAAQGSAWHWSQRLQNIFPAGLPGQEPLPLPTTVPRWPCRLPSALAFKYIQSPLPSSLLPPLSPLGREHLNPPPSDSFPHNGHTVFISFCMWH